VLRGVGAQRTAVYCGGTSRARRGKGIRPAAARGHSCCRQHGAGRVCYNARATASPRQGSGCDFRRRPHETHENPGCHFRRRPHETPGVRGSSFQRHNMHQRTSRARRGGGAGSRQCSCNCVAPPGVRVPLSSATARNPGLRGKTLSMHQGASRARRGRSPKSSQLANAIPWPSRRKLP